ncbi:MAG: hypothetical protein IID15_03190 [Candidatus Marinimicrobia bacterium]|nr:hypothetical protein [Candidatus Neomarinimicrobiota bacterium]
MPQLVFTAVVTMEGGVRITGDIPAESVGAFLGWLKENFIEEARTDDRFGEADTKKVDHDD